MRTTVTVAILSDCQASTLERAICSVLDQLDPGEQDRLELIILDAFSDDGTDAILKSYRSDAKVMLVDPSHGQAAALNEALTVAKGELLVPLDANDILMPGALYEAVTAHRRGARWIVPQAARIDAGEQAVGSLPSLAPENLCDLLRHHNAALPVSGSGYDTAMLKQHQGFDAESRYAYGFELAARLIAMQERPIVLPQTLVGRHEYRQDHDAAIDFIREGMDYLRVATRYLEHLNAMDRVVLREQIAESHRIYAVAQAEMHRSASRRYLWQQLLRRPHWLARDTYRHRLLSLEVDNRTQRFEDGNDQRDAA